MLLFAILGSMAVVAQLKKHEDELREHVESITTLKLSLLDAYAELHAVRRRAKNLKARLDREHNETVDVGCLVKKLEARLTELQRVTEASFLKRDFEIIETQDQVERARNSGLCFIDLVANEFMRGDEKVDVVSWRLALFPECAQELFALSEDSKSLTIEKTGYYKVYMYFTCWGTVVCARAALCINPKSTESGEMDSTPLTLPSSFSLTWVSECKGSPNFSQVMSLSSGNTLAVKLQGYSEGIAKVQVGIHVSYLG